jgi:hypothetical protein
MEAAARLTLGIPHVLRVHWRTFDDMFGGLALRDLARYRKRCRDSLIACIESLLDSRLPPSDIWVGCPNSNQSYLVWMAVQPAFTTSKVTERVIYASSTLAF